MCTRPFLAALAALTLGIALALGAAGPQMGAAAEAEPVSASGHSPLAADHCRSSVSTQHPAPHCPDCTSACNPPGVVLAHGSPIGSAALPARWFGSRPDPTSRAPRPPLRPPRSA